jgi:hypothetical protein
MKVETIKVKYVETKKPRSVQSLWSWFFMKKVEKPIEIWEEAFPWP